MNGPMIPTNATKEFPKNEDHCPFFTSSDPSMIDIHARLGKLAKTPVHDAILITGETGVGKEVLAKQLHALSNRRKGNFVVVNCAAIAESLFERELFGCKKGAYTGATSDEPGYFEQADGGTILLDEIGELPRHLQSKLLRILEDRQVFRVGDPKPRPVDVRIIAATNQDLECAVTQNTFRSDLLFRLNAFEIRVPPLRMRTRDIPALAEYLLEQHSALGGSAPLRLAPKTIVCLQAYHFPGNVRELKNVLSSAALECPDALILPEHLPLRLRVQIGLTPNARAKTQDARALRREAEFQQIRWALEQTAGNQTRAARLLGMPLRTFVLRLERHGFPRPKKSEMHPCRPTA